MTTLPRELTTATRRCCTPLALAAALAAGLAGGAGGCSPQQRTFTYSSAQAGNVLASDSLGATMVSTHADERTFAGAFAARHTDPTFIPTARRSAAANSPTE